MWRRRRSASLVNARLHVHRDRVAIRAAHPGVDPVAIRRGLGERPVAIRRDPGDPVAFVPGGRPDRQAHFARASTLR